MEIEIKSKPPL